VEITKNSFFEIFSDAITLYELSVMEQKSHIKKTLAKSSILSINYALEAAANSFLSSIEITQKLKGQIDRFSTLDKLDYTLQWHKETACSGQQKLATALEFFQNNRSDSFGVKPPLY